MATQAHCAYCFESLNSTLTKQGSLSLHEVETLWKKWNNGSPLPTDPASPPPFDSELEDPSLAPIDVRPAAISRLVAPSPSTASSSSVQSVASTPSRTSVASSATSKSGSSSRSSFFGPGNKSKKGVASGFVGEDGEEQEMEQMPLFVTWNTLSKSGGEKRLRGCIGTFEAMDLDEGLSSYALTSALDDTRFHPITVSELPTLEVGVTLLTNFEPISTALDWEIGTHGLRINFNHNGRRYGSTYLPDVAREQGWTKEETMVSLMRKAGWSGRKEEWRKVDLNVIRYQGRQVNLSWGSFKEWREWVEEVMNS
ncbi:hypothetical protein K504DRAFT_462579 [Pleomassaria siparia CBS 279.74]|uniref:AMMECR1 domain-containing protein n=1 Tax=Pleomassaria siparia CBS 279.74 TaxID=1314801 RepID=A0A6G1KMM6_9PLEO|nr:hypothetical protein K504DRAFT_462579 [Pleomassaria siparia CBS 279.74]